MTNHPNRAWRAKMHYACAAYLAEWHWPDAGAGVLMPHQLRDMMRSSYVIGYTAGRESLQRGKSAAPDAPTAAREK